VDAVHLIDGHLVVFEVVVVETLLEDAGEEIVGEDVLLGEACCRDGFEARQVGEVFGMATLDGCEGVVGELIIVTIVPEGGGAFGGVLEVGLIELFEESVLGGEAGFARRGRGLGGEGVGCGEGEAGGEEQREKLRAHEARVAEVISDLRYFLWLQFRVQSATVP
jgi:hypothetical protein